MSDPTSRALSGLRRDAARAQRRPERGLMIAIGLEEPDDDASSKGTSDVNKDRQAGGAEDIAAAEASDAPMLPEDYVDLIEQQESDPEKDEEAEVSAELEERKRRLGRL